MPVGRKVCGGQGVDGGRRRGVVGGGVGRRRRRRSLRSLLRRPHPPPPPLPLPPPYSPCPPCASTPDSTDSHSTRPPRKRPVCVCVRSVYARCVYRGGGVSVENAHSSRVQSHQRFVRTISILMKKSSFIKGFTK
jgi:hypothetical protein